MSKSCLNKPLNVVILATCGMAFIIVGVTFYIIAASAVDAYQVTVICSLFIFMLASGLMMASCMKLLIEICTPDGDSLPPAKVDNVELKDETPENALEEGENVIPSFIGIPSDDGPEYKLYSLLKSKISGIERLEELERQIPHLDPISKEEVELILYLFRIEEEAEEAERMLEGKIKPETMKEIIKSRETKIPDFQGSKKSRFFPYRDRKPLATHDVRRSIRALEREMITKPKRDRDKIRASDMRASSQYGRGDLKYESITDENANDHALIETYLDRRSSRASLSKTSGTNQRGKSLVEERSDDSSKEIRRNMDSPKSRSSRVDGAKKTLLRKKKRSTSERVDPVVMSVMEIQSSIQDEEEKRKTAAAAAAPPPPPPVVPEAKKDRRRGN